MNRAQLKHRSRQSMSWAKPGPMIFTLVYMLIPLALQGASSANSVFSLLDGGGAATMGLRSTALSLAVMLLYSVVEAGYTKYCLVSHGAARSRGTPCWSM